MNTEEFKQALLKYREEEVTHPLIFMPRIEHLIDHEYCLNLNELLLQEGYKWEKRKATSELGISLPDEAGLYMFVWKPTFSLTFDSGTVEEYLSWVLYIGQAGGKEEETGTIKKRYTGEYYKYIGKDISQLWEKDEITKREQLLARYLTLRPLEYWFLTVDNKSEIHLLERKLIKLLRPPLNRQYGPKLRTGKTEKVV